MATKHYTIRQGCARLGDGQSLALQSLELQDKEPPATGAWALWNAVAFEQVKALPACRSISMPEKRNVTPITPGCEAAD